MNTDSESKPRKECLSDCVTQRRQPRQTLHTRPSAPRPRGGQRGGGGACPCPWAGPPLVLHHMASFHHKPTSQEPLAEVTGDSRFVSVKLLTERSGRWRCRPALGLPGWPGAAPSGAVPPKPHARRAVTEAQPREASGRAWPAGGGLAAEVERGTSVFLRLAGIEADATGLLSSLPAQRTVGAAPAPGGTRFLDGRAVSPSQGPRFPGGRVK